MKLSFSAPGRVLTSIITVDFSNRVAAPAHAVAYECSIDLAYSN